MLVISLEVKRAQGHSSEESKSRKAMQIISERVVEKFRYASRKYIL